MRLARYSATSTDRRIGQADTRILCRIAVLFAFALAALGWFAHHAKVDRAATLSFELDNTAKAVRPSPAIVWRDATALRSEVRRGRAPSNPSARPGLATAATAPSFVYLAQISRGLVRPSFFLDYRTWNPRDPPRHMSL